MLLRNWSGRCAWSWAPGLYLHLSLRVSLKPGSGAESHSPPPRATTCFRGLVVLRWRNRSPGQPCECWQFSHQAEHPSLPSPCPFCDLHLMWQLLMVSCALGHSFHCRPFVSLSQKAVSLLGVQTCGEGPIGQNFHHHITV